MENEKARVKYEREREREREGEREGGMCKYDDMNAWSIGIMKSV